MKPESLHRFLYTIFKAHLLSSCLRLLSMSVVNAKISALSLCLPKKVQLYMESRRRLFAPIAGLQACVLVLAHMWTYSCSTLIGFPHTRISY